MRLISTALVLASLSLTPLPAQGYVASDLDGNGLLGVGAAFRTSEAGTAVGIGLPVGGSYSRAVTWTGLQTTVLPPLSGHESAFANDVSETGIVVGASEDVVEQGQLLLIFREAVMWVNGNPIALNAVANDGAALVLDEAIAIDEHGRIMGQGRDPSIPAARGFLLENGTVTDLGSLSADGDTEPFDMNQQGHVVGRAEVAGSVDHAFVWRSGAITDLHDPAVIVGGISAARAINEAGVIVGSGDFVSDGSLRETAAIWKDGVITDLGAIAGPQSQANDINDHGTIVGTSTWSGAGVHAFVYRGGVMEDLNELIPTGSGWTLSNAHDVANDGRIIGEGFNSLGKRPFLLVPDCGTGYSVYGAGCDGSGGYAPSLWGQGCEGGDVSFAITGGLGGAPAVLAFGSGQGVLPVRPGCELQILPTIPARLPVTLGGVGDGAGTWQAEFPLVQGFPPVTLFLQALVLDGGAPRGFTLTSPLQWEIQ